MDKKQEPNVGRAKRDLSFLRMAAVGFMLAVVASAHPQPASACGWWGDGEVDDNDAIAIGPDGQPVFADTPVWGKMKDQHKETAIPKNLQVPAPRSGYGIVVRRDGSAIPYLKAVPSKSIYSIQQLHRAGFSTVIDLGTMSEVAALHRRETEALGMKYFNIPTEGDVLGAAHITRFNEILSTTGNLPILVFSASANLLGEMWAYHRLANGLPREEAVREGRGLGLSENAARDFKSRAGFQAQ